VYDYRTPLSVVLEPGDYALVFGSDYLGASGGDGRMANLIQQNLPGSSYFFWDGSSWHNTNPYEPPRFVVEGITEVTISGYIQTDDSTAIDGVLVSADNGGGSDTTDASGYYELTVPYNWSGTVTPTKTYWIFAPESQTYSNVVTDQAGQDYTGAELILISGHVADVNGIVMEGVQVSANNGGGSDTTDANGYYDLHLPPGWSGTVTPGKIGWGFDPESRTYSNVTADQTDQDYTAFQPKISGHITDANGFGIDGIAVSADNAGGSDTTDANGHYEVTVPYNWSGTVTPNAPPDWGFIPVNHSYINITADQINQDFMIFQPEISGHIEDAGGIGIEGIVVSADNGGGSDTTDANGYYEIVVVYGWSGTVRPGKTDWGFNPVERTYSNIVADQTNQDFMIFQPGISGYIKDAGGIAIEGVTVLADNGAGSDTTDANGYYEIVVVYGWSGTVVPTTTGFGIDPSHRIYNSIISDQINQNYLARVSQTFVVRADGTGDYPTIQSAIDATLNTDTIIAADGIYTGVGSKNLDFKGKAITVRSENGPANCIIDCEASGRGFQFHSGEDAGSVLDGVTIRNGRVQNNEGGGAIECLSSNPTIRNCVFSGNYAQSYGGGMSNTDASSPMVTNCIFFGNRAGEDSGGGMWNNEATPTVTNCTFTANIVPSDHDGGGLYNLKCSPMITNCIVRGNGGRSEIRGGVNVTYSNVEGGYSGTGNINSDPNFAFNDNFHLLPDSPCIDAGTNDPPGGLSTTDIEGNPRSLDGDNDGNSVADMGAYEYDNLAPYIGVWPRIVEFLASRNNSNPEPKTVSIRCISDSSINWEISYQSQWLNVSPVSGTSSGDNNEVLLSVDVNDLPLEDYTCEVTITDPCAINNPQTFQVNLHIMNPVISGHIRDSNQDPISDVLVSTSDGTDTDTTDANGYYEVTVSYNWSGTITPDKHWCVFEPNQWTYANVTTNQTNQDYTAFPPPIISGYIRDSNDQGLSGALVWASDVTDSSTTDANGYYELIVPEGFSGTVTPKKTFWFFEPNGLAYENVTEDRTNQNFTAIAGVIISGYITNVGGKYVKNVDVEAENVAGKATTDVNGFYELAVPPGFSGTVTASTYVRPGPPPPGAPPGWIIHRKFEPTSHSYNNLVADIAEKNYLMLGIRVRSDGTGDARSIWRAVHAAIAGDEVILEPGRYTGWENTEIDFRGRAITIRSVAPNNPAVVAATIIDANRLCPGIYFDSGEGPDSVVDGLTITRGHSGIGGGIACRDSSPTIRNCIIRDCYAMSHGGGIGLEDSNATIINCIVTDNSTTEMGGGIACVYSGSPSIINCLITGNSVGWTGGGIASSGCNLAISNCTLVGNNAKNRYNNSGWGGAISIAGIANISNCILWDNNADQGPEIAIHLFPNGPSTVSVSYCDVDGGEAGVYIEPGCTFNWDNAGNIDTDPCFAQPGYWIIVHISGPQPPPPLPPPDYTVYLWVNGDYHLRSRAGRWESSIYLRLNPTNDRFINLFDFAAFAHSWQQEGSSIPADLDRSGFVNSFDLKLVLDNYLSSYTVGQWVTDEFTSPCIDAGNPNSDWTGELWPHGRRINMGAYGGRPQASMSLSDVGNIADLVADDCGCIGYIDMKQLTDKWLYAEVPLAEDLDRNGIVNFTDFAIFTTNLAFQPGLPGLHASNPYPPDMAGITNLDPDLSWTTGPYPISHDVYFGTSNPPPFIGNQTAPTFNPGTMTEGTTYYWRIDEVSDYCTFMGTVWRFTIMTGPPPPPL
jgi:hypothetical protein